VIAVKGIVIVTATATVTTAAVVIMTAMIATTAAAVVSDAVAAESAVLPSPMRTRPTAAKHRQTVNDPIARSAHSPPLVSAVRIVSAIEETATASVTVNVIEATVISSAVRATDEKMNASACIALVEIPVVAVMSSITVRLAALPVQIVDAAGRVTLKVWRAGQRSDTAVIAVSGIVARVLDAVGGNALRSQKSRARRMRRLFTLAARRERLRRIKFGCVYIDRLVGYCPLDMVHDSSNQHLLPYPCIGVYSLSPIPSYFCAQVSYVFTNRTNDSQSGRMLDVKVVWYAYGRES
jgi:hypothetical protein